MSGVRIYAAGETSIHAWMESAFAWDACSVQDLKRGAAMYKEDPAPRG